MKQNELITPGRFLDRWTFYWIGFTRAAYDIQDNKVHRLGLSGLTECRRLASEASIGRGFKCR